MHDRIRFILYTGANEHGKQPYRTSPTLGQLLLQLLLSMHKGLVLSPARINFSPSGPNFVQKPIQQLVKQPERSDVIPPTKIAGQKQLIPCPMTDLEATVDRKQITISSRELPASRRNSVNRYWYQLCPVESLCDFRRESLSDQLQGTANDSAQ